MRTVVIRTEGYVETRINDEIGLTPCSSYTIAEYLEDQALYEGRTLLAQCGGAYAFSDDIVELLTEHKERIQEELLDPESRALLRQQECSELPQLTRERDTFIC